MSDVYAWRDQREVLGEAIRAEMKRQVDAHRKAWIDARASRRWWRMDRPDIPMADFEAIGEAAIVEIQKWPIRHARSF